MSSRWTPVALGQAKQPQIVSTLRGNLLVTYNLTWGEAGPGDLTTSPLRHSAVALTVEGGCRPPPQVTDIPLVAYKSEELLPFTGRGHSAPPQ